LASEVGQLVDEAFHDESVLRWPDRAPEPQGHAEVLVHPLDPDVRDVVGMVADVSIGRGVGPGGRGHELTRLAVSALGTSSSIQARWTECSFWADTPSIVVTFLPTTAETGV
jgi:hypothetical protein